MSSSGNPQQEQELLYLGYQLHGSPLRGSFGDVWDAELLKRKRKVAIKILEPTPHKRAHVEQEARILLRLHPHQNVVDWYDVHTDFRHGVYVVMEMSILGDIERYMRMHAPDGLPRITRQYIFRQIASGLQYIHELRICHGNLKPSNILLFRGTQEKLNAKLSNFGSAREYRENSCLHGLVGSPPFSAPETQFARAYYRPEPIDVYSLGIILSYMMLASTPNRSPINHRCEFLTSLRTATGTDVLERSMIQRLTHEDPLTRSKIAMILKHPYYRTADGEGLPVTINHRFSQTMSTIGALVLLEYQPALNMSVRHSGNRSTNNNSSRRRRRHHRNSSTSPHSPRCRSMSVRSFRASQQNIPPSLSAKNSRRIRSRSRRRGGHSASPSSPRRHK